MSTCLAAGARICCGISVLVFVCDKSLKISERGREGGSERERERDRAERCKSLARTDLLVLPGTERVKKLASSVTRQGSADAEVNA